MKEHDNWNRNWWTIENRLVVPSADAPEWLVREFEDYNEAWEAYDAALENMNAFSVKEPSSRHPIIDRMTDDEYDEMCRLVREDSH